MDHLNLKKSQNNNVTNNNLTPDAILNELIRHIYACGEVYRGDVNSIVGNNGYAAQLLTRYKDIFRMFGKGKNCAVKIIGYSDSSTERAERILSRIDANLAKHWINNTTEERNTDAGIRRQRIFRRARFSFLMRKAGACVDFFDRTTLAEGGNNVFPPLTYFDACEIKNATTTTNKLGLKASKITGTLYTPYAIFALYGFEKEEEITQTRASTEKNMSVFLSNLFYSNKKQPGEICAIACMDESLLTKETMNALAKNLGIAYRRVLFMPNNTKDAARTIKLLSDKNATLKASVSMFDEKNIIKQDLIDHAFTGETKEHVAILPDIKALSQIQNKTKRGAQHTLGSIQKIPDYNIHAFADQATLFKRLFDDQDGIVIKRYNPKKLMQIISQIDDTDLEWI